MDLPTLSICVLNYNGRRFLEGCFDSLLAVSYPREQIDLILVDNASTDDSLEFMRTYYPQVRLLQRDRNEGFSKANNFAATMATGKYVAFLNNDMHLDREWALEMVRPLSRGESVVCTASKILSRDGKQIDFVGGGINFYGHGLSDAYGMPNDDRLYTEEKPIPFACGGAMLIDRQVFLTVGGFDEDLYAYFEDTDLGWRLWVLGYEVIFAPKAVAYHHHHGTWERLSFTQRFTLLERNALYSIIKNYEQVNLDRILPLALLLAVKRFTLQSGLDWRSFVPGSTGAATKEAKEEKVKLSRQAFSSLAAIDQVTENVVPLMEKRRRIQSARTRTDAEFIALFPDKFLAPNILEPAYVSTMETLLKNWHTGDFLRQPACRRLLIIGHDTLSEKMAGPAVRYWELARVLSRHFQVTLAAPGEPNVSHPDFRVVGYRRANDESIAPFVAEADVILTPAYLLHELPSLRASNKPLILDIYDPFVLEIMAAYSTFPMAEQQQIHSSYLAVLNQQLLRGDFFICASERQRYYWLGMLAALNRINPATYDQDKSVRKLIGVVPFGLPSTPPQHTRAVLKGVHPGIRPDDKVILWAGGIWPWFDPLTLIRAVAEIAKQRQDVKLFFMGKGHFDPKVVPTAEMADRAMRLSRELGVLDKFVFFGDWSLYEDRQNYLLEANIGASLHYDHIETRYAFRTRLLDYFWSGLPILCTRGDSLAAVVEKSGLGKIVDAEDVDAVRNGLLALLDTPNLRESLRDRFARVAEEFQWERVAQPIVEFCQSPYRAPDRFRPPSEAGTENGATPLTRGVTFTPWLQLPARGWAYFRRGGIGTLWRAMAFSMRRRFAMRGKRIR
jgi:GT2 family glycosyltransferase/glycosyltransferase involved in cell wall biosynthesis